MTPSDAQLADEREWYREGVWVACEDEGLVMARSADAAADIVRDHNWLVAALRDARAENERERATVAHYQGVLIATCAEKAEVQRREAEMRERIEALCDETRNWHVYPTRDAGDCFGFDTVNDFVVDLRAALSPAEEQR